MNATGLVKSHRQAAKEDVAAIVMTALESAKRRAAVDIAEVRKFQAMLDSILADIDPEVREAVPS